MNVYDVLLVWKCKQKGEDIEEQNSSRLFVLAENAEDAVEKAKKSETADIKDINSDELEYIRMEEVRLSIEDVLV